MKILYIDYWLRGITHFLRVDAEFKRRGCSTQLLHLSSWIEKNVKDEQTIDGIWCTDISYYKKSIFECIKSISPDKVICLNAQSMTDRTILKSCQILGIPYIYLSHGRLTSNEFVKEGLKNTAKIYKKQIIKRVLKNFLYVFPEYYLVSSQNNEGVFSIVKDVISLLKNPAKNTTYSDYKKYFNIPRTIVYSLADKKFLVEARGFPSESIKVVGNPDFSGLNKYIQEDNSNENIMLYLEDGVVQNGAMSKDRWYVFVEELYQLAKEKNHRLEIKLHPRTLIDEHKSFFSNKKDIVIYTNEVLVDVIRKSKICVSFYSSTILVALALQKKVISPRWGILKDTLKLYPEDVVRYVYEKKEFWKEEPLNQKKLKDYLYEEIGDIDEPFDKRVVDEIIRLKN